MREYGMGLLILVFAGALAVSIGSVSGCTEHGSSGSSSGHSANADPQSAAPGKAASGKPADDPALPVDSETETDQAQDPPAGHSADRNGDSASPQADAAVDQTIQSLRQSLQKKTRALRGRIKQQHQQIAHLEHSLAKLTQRVDTLAHTTRAGADDPPKPDPQPADPPADRPSHGDRTAATKAAELTSRAGKDAGPAPSDPAGDWQPADCNSRHAPAFDVAYHAASDTSLAAVVKRIRQADIADYFTAPNAWLYLGHYATCHRAARRRKAIHQRAHLTARILAGRAVHNTHPTPHAAHSQPHADSAHVAFRVVSVERRGDQRLVGVTIGTASRMTHIHWLARGDRYHAWRLTGIDGRHATFAGHGRHVALALPNGA